MRSLTFLSQSILHGLLILLISLVFFFFFLAFSFLIRMLGCVLQALSA